MEGYIIIYIFNTITINANKLNQIKHVNKFTSFSYKLPYLALFGGSGLENKASVLDPR